MFHHKGVVSSYAMKNLGFGIEFCNNMDLYEANYGMQMQTGSKVEVNNEAIIPENGFVTCKYCGKSTPLLSKLNKEHKPVELFVSSHANRSHKDSATYPNHGCEGCCGDV